MLMIRQETDPGLSLADSGARRRLGPGPPVIGHPFGQALASDVIAALGDLDCLRQDRGDLLEREMFPTAQQDNQPVLRSQSIQVVQKQPGAMGDACLNTLVGRSGNRAGCTTRSQGEPVSQQIQTEPTGMAKHPEAEILPDTCVRSMVEGSRERRCRHSIGLGVIAEHVQTQVLDGATAIGHTPIKGGWVVQVENLRPVERVDRVLTEEGKHDGPRGDRLNTSRSILNTLQIRRTFRTRPQRSSHLANRPGTVQLVAITGLPQGSRSRRSHHRIGSVCGVDRDGTRPSHGPIERGMRAPIPWASGSFPG